MAILQIYTRPAESTESKLKSVEKSTESNDFELLKPQHERWIDFCAAGGLMVDEAGSWKTTTVKDFAVELGVSRETLYYWKKSIPGFKDKVKERKKEINGDPERLAKAWNGIFLKTCGGDARAGTLFFANFDPDFRMPTQKIDHEVGGLADLMQIARMRRKQQEPIEGEIVNVDNTATIDA